MSRMDWQIYFYRSIYLVYMNNSVTMSSGNIRIDLGDHFFCVLYRRERDIY